MLGRPAVSQSHRPPYSLPTASKLSKAIQSRNITMSLAAFEDAVRRAVTPGPDRLFAGVAFAAASRGKGMHSFFMS